MASSLVYCIALLAAIEGRDPAAYPTVCRVQVPSGGGASSLGSGTCVYSQAVPPSSYVLTAAHVIRGGTGSPSVLFPDGQRYRCRVSYNNPQQDVAILHFHAARPAFTQISQTMPNKGESVTFVGFGGQRPYFLAYSGPVVGAVGSGSGGRDTLEAFVPQISQGDSGGAVLYRGYVVGTISAKDNRGNGLASVVSYRQQTRQLVPSSDQERRIDYRFPPSRQWHPILTPQTSMLPDVYRQRWVYLPYIEQKTKRK